MKIGWDLSGTVVAIGDAVREFKVGDEVFGCLEFHQIGILAGVGSREELIGYDRFGFGICFDDRRIYCSQAKRN